MEKYETVKKLGGGAFGTVVQVQRKEDKQIFAMKRIPDEAEHFVNACIQVRSEVKILQSIQHPCIVQYVDYFEHEDKFLLTNYHCIVMEYCSNGTLHDVICNQSGEHFSDKDILQFLAQLAWSLDTIHSKNIIHRDIKPQNVLVHKTGLLKLADFGLCKEIKFNQSKATPTFGGTHQYMSPEIVSGSSYDTSADIWSLGCVLYELIELRPAFVFNANVVNLMNMITSGDYPPVRKTVAPCLDTLMTKMLNVNARLRPSAGDLLADSFVLNSLERVKQNIARMLENSNRSSQMDPQAFSLMPLTDAQRKKFSSFNMSPLEPDNEGKYANVDWQKLKKVYELKWKDIVNGNVEWNLDFPPLHVLDERAEVVAVLYGKRRGNEFRIYGGFHSEVAREVDPLNVRLQLRMEFMRTNEQRFVNEKDLVISLENKQSNGGYYPLLIMYDIPWSDLSASITPLATLIRICPTNPPLSKFYYAGLEPISAIDGDFGSIEWGNFEGTFSNKREWQKIVAGDEQAVLHFPPLIVPRNIIDDVVVIMFAKRAGTDLQFCGGFHKNVDKSVKECKVAVNFELQFHHENGKVDSRIFNQSITFKHPDVNTFKSIFSISALTWSDLSPRTARLLFKPAISEVILQGFC